MAETLNQYKSNLTPEEVDQALHKIGQVDDSIAQAQAYAEQSAQYAQSIDPAGFAPKSHADSGTQYGMATDSLYGHVKLSDTTGSSDASGGVAVTPKGVQDAINAVTVGGFNVSAAQVTMQNVRQSGRVVVVDLQVENNGMTFGTDQFLLGYVTGVSMPSYYMQSSGGQGTSQYDIGMLGNAYTYLGKDGSVYIKPNGSSVMHIHVHFVYIANE